MNKQFWSADRHFGLRLDARLLHEILDYCSRANHLETGGILIGQYNPEHTCALVDIVTGPPSDSRQSRSFFIRGVSGLRALLRTLWKREGAYYLGEWHYHPGGSPIPSAVDTKQMFSIAQSKRYACPEPILLILGGNPLGRWTLGASVFTGKGENIPLVES